MLVIYEPKGRAKEYAPWAANLYRGCGHGCTYCYAPKVIRMEPDEFHGSPKPRADVIEKLEKDCKSLQANRQSINVLLCFTCDPCQPINDTYRLTEKAIVRLQRYGQSVTILTKGGKYSGPALLLLRPGVDEYAATLTFIDKAKSLEWEPGAASPEERMRMLKIAHKLGIRTWVSLEPVIDPEESLRIITETALYADQYKLGILNHHPLTKEIDWRDYAHKAIRRLNNYDKSYYIKHDLRPFLPPGTPIEYFSRNNPGAGGAE